MKTTIKLALALSLLLATVTLGFAQAADDGNMGNGTKDCQNCLVQIIPDETDPNSMKNQKLQIANNQDEDNDLLSFLQEFFNKFFG